MDSWIRPTIHIARVLHTKERNIENHSNYAKGASAKDHTLYWSTAPRKGKTKHRRYHWIGSVRITLSALKYFDQWHFDWQDKQAIRKINTLITNLETEQGTSY